jgi:hypothetical protein
MADMADIELPLPAQLYAPIAGSGKAELSCAQHKFS